MRSVTEYVEGEGSGYTIRLERLDPDEDPALEREGYRSETTLYVVLGGGQVWADHNPHRLVRNMPGANDWLHDEFDRLRERLGVERIVEIDGVELTDDQIQALRPYAARLNLTLEETASLMVRYGIQMAVEELGEDSIEDVDPAELAHHILDDWKGEDDA